MHCKVYVAPSTGLLWELVCVVVAVVSPSSLSHSLLLLIIGRRRRRRSHDEWVGNGWWETSRKNKREGKVRISPLISKRNLSHFIISSDWSLIPNFIFVYVNWGILSLFVWMESD